MLRLFLLTVMVFFGYALECTVYENEKCMPRNTLIKTNPHGYPHYYPFEIKVKRCLGSYETLDNPMARSCLTNKSKTMYTKVYDLLYNKFVALSSMRTPIVIALVVWIKVSLQRTNLGMM